MVTCYITIVTAGGSCTNITAISSCCYGPNQVVACASIYFTPLLVPGPIQLYNPAIWRCIAGTGTSCKYITSICCGRYCPGNILPKSAKAFIPLFIAVCIQFYNPGSGALLAAVAICISCYYITSIRRRPYGISIFGRRPAKGFTPYFITGSIYFFYPYICTAMVASGIVIIALCASGKYIPAICSSNYRPYLFI